MQKTMTLEHLYAASTSSYTPSVGRHIRLHHNLSACSPHATYAGLGFLRGSNNTERYGLSAFIRGLAI